MRNIRQRIGLVNKFLRHLRVTDSTSSRRICLEGSDGFVTFTIAPIRLWRIGRSDPVAGWEFHPLQTDTFPRRTK
jgi:hypothetical protein